MPHEDLLSPGGIMVGAYVFDPGDIGVRGAVCGSCAKAVPTPEQRTDHMRQAPPSRVIADVVPPLR